MSTDPTPVDLDGSSVDGPSYTLSRVIDGQWVWLRDVSKVPNVPKVFGKTEVVVETIGFHFERPAPGADYTLDRIRVIGSRAKKDGTASAQGMEESFTGASNSSGYRAAPIWLRDLAEAHRPQQAGPTHVFEPADRDDEGWRPPFDF